MAEITAQEIATLQAQKERLRIAANRYLDNADKLPVTCTLEDVVQVFESYDEYSYMNAFLNSIEVFPDKDYSINDTEGHIKGLRPNAFAENGALKSVNLSGVTAMGNLAFKGCTNLQSIVMENVASASTVDAFIVGCSNLVELKLPRLTNFLTSSNAPNGGNTLFSGTKVKNLNLPQALMEINGYWSKTLLNNANLLETMLIGKNNEFKDTANNYFPNNMKAFVITYQGDNIKLYGGNGVTSFTSVSNLYVYVPQALLSTYRSATNWVSVHQAKTDGNGNYNGIQDIESNLAYLRGLGVDFSCTPYADESEGEIVE